MDYDEEVVCIGDLHKKNVSGRKAWNLRRFALLGVNMVYYKQGIKRGEWDITGCTIRKMSPEECNQPAAKFAFGVEGPKKSYLFSANSEKNREKWIEILSKQIDEYKDASRRFVRRGEVILGSGLLKRRNLFGKVQVKLIVTNFPRIIVIDPSTLTVKDQATWIREHSSFSKIDKTKFKISIQAKDLHFEDPEGGMLYWENVFRLVDTAELYSPKKFKVIKIGLPGSDDDPQPVSNDPKQVRAAQNLKFLEEGAANINQLLITLNTKIDLIDSALASAISDGWIIAEQNAAAYQEKLVKRTQFEMLKENVEMIAENLEKLTEQTRRAPLTTSFDRVAIQNVIDEAGTLLSLLNSDEEEEEDDNDDINTQDVQFGDEVQNVDAIISQMEEDNLATEEIIANVEYLSLFDDDSIQKLNENFDSIKITSDITITPETYDPGNISVRPAQWKDIRTKRLLIKEYVERLEGTLEDQILENRKTALAKEEVLMVQEIASFGRLLNMAAVMETGGIEKAAMTVTIDNFDPNSPDARPPAWKAIRLRRAIAKEDITKNVEDAEYVRLRPKRVMEEEKVMLDEVARHGHILTYGAPSENPDRANEAANNSSNERVTLIRERANTIRDRAYTIRDKETIGGARTRVMSQAPVYRGRASSVLPPVTSFDINEDSFDPYDENVRPEGWMDIRMKRIMAKEEMERLEGVDEETIILSRKKKISQEEELMVAEVMKYGNVVGMQNKLNIIGMTPPVFIGAVREPSPEPAVRESEVVNEGDVEWREILMKRVLTKEQADREAGVDEDTILSRRKEREEEERKLMEEEVVAHGKVLGVKEPGRRRAASLQQDVVTLEINEDNFDAADPKKRPATWSDLRNKRVMLKEHIDRIGGVSETAIIAKRLTREIDEEIIMVGEVICYGRLLGVGETGRTGQSFASLTINSDTFNALDSNKRPHGWQSIRSQRVALKELEDRLNNIAEEVIQEKRKQRDSEEEIDMIQEAETTGQIALLGTRSSAKYSKRDSTSKIPIEKISELSIETKEAPSMPEPQEPKLDIEITAKDFDPNNPNQRPKGWADIKLRKVYLKEWQDRKDGVDEDEIMNRRYQRELEAEEEMSQAITVFGRIQLIENRIQARKAAPLFPKEFVKVSSSGPSRTKAVVRTNKNTITAQISASSMSLEAVGNRISKLAEQNSA